MPSCSKADVVLVAYPFTELETRKVRPAIVVSSPGDRYQDVFIVPIIAIMDSMYRPLLRRDLPRPPKNR